MLCSLAAAVLVKIDFFAGAALAVVGGGLIGIALLVHTARSPAAQHVGAAPASRKAGAFRAAARWIDGHELWLLVLFSPLFVFSLRALSVVVLLIPLLWLSRRLSRGYFTRPSPFNLPVLCLCLMLIPSLLVAIDLDLAAPKFVGLIFGIGLYSAILNTEAHDTGRLVSAGVVWASLAITLIALVGTDWPAVGKLSIYAPIYEALPRLVPVLPRAISTSEVINANHVGGTLAWTLPFVIGLWVVARQANRRAPAGQLLRSLAWQLLLIVTMLLSSALLFLTQSRSAIIAITGALPFLVAIYIPFFRKVLVAGVIIVIGTVYILGPARITDFVIRAGDAHMGNAPEVTLSGRLLIWQQGMEAVRRFPLTGIGLNNFDAVRFRLGVADTTGQEQRIETHAHNLYLQAAVDLGLPGLAAYVALLACALGGLLWLTQRGSERAVRGLAAAVFVALLAHQAFGLVDAITLGAKPG